MLNLQKKGFHLGETQIPCQRNISLGYTFKYDILLMAACKQFVVKVHYHGLFLSIIEVVYESYM